MNGRMLLDTATRYLTIFCRETFGLCVTTEQAEGIHIQLMLNEIRDRRTSLPWFNVGEPCYLGQSPFVEVLLPVIRLSR